MEVVLPKLVEAVEAVMNPTTNPIIREKAYNFCEDFKEHSPYCLECGLELARKENNAFLRHIGLQLVENHVKYKWNDMVVDQKLFLKNGMMTLMMSGTLDILTEESHIKEAISKVMVEIIKREWPQQYPTLLDEFNQLVAKGPIQTELVMRILKRLMEDVYSFVTLPQNRKKDIMAGLTSNMEALFQLFASCSVDKFISTFKNESAVSPDGSVESCLINATLDTLCVYLEWLNPMYIFYRDGTLVRTFCDMLHQQSLQLHAVECLLVMTSRKIKPEDRHHMLIFFNKQTMDTILSAATKASQADLDPHHFLFMKQLCQVLIKLGNQLTSLWGQSFNGSVFEKPDTFPQYLEAILAFTQHPSQVLSRMTMPLWATFLKHDSISTDPILVKDFVPKLLQYTRRSLLKVGYPSLNNSASCDYSRIDFDSDDDFHNFFIKFRTEVTEVIRLCTGLQPDLAFTFAQHWLQHQLQQPLQSGSVPEPGQYPPQCPIALEWDALSVLLDNVIHKLTHLEQYSVPGVTMLRAVTALETQDPVILSTHLSIGSSLFPFIRYEPSVLPVLLDKIFAAAVFNMQGQTKATRSRSVRNVRRHACCGLIKVCKEYPDLLFPGFEQLYSHITHLGADPDELSQMEQITLIEALLLISNEFKDYQRMNDFLVEILKPLKSIWLAEDLKQALWDPIKFMSFVGLDQPPVEPSSADHCGINRSQILYCLNLLHGTLKRFQPPADLETARRGGFLVTTDTGEEVVRNPASPHVLVLLENVLALSRTFVQLWNPSLLQRRHPVFANAYDLMDSEKQTILGNQPSSSDNLDAPVHKDPPGRMLSFMTMSHDVCYMVLGSACQFLGPDFYKLENLSDYIKSFTLTNLDLLPDHKLKIILRFFLKPFAQNCPVSCRSSVLVPVLTHVCPYLLNRLNTRWHQLIQGTTSHLSGDPEDDKEAEEILKDLMLRLVSHEYLEIICFLVKGYQGAPAKEEVPSQRQEEQPTIVQNMHHKEAMIGELGHFLLNNETVYPHIAMALFSAIVWPDSACMNKCMAMAFPVLKKLEIAGKMTGEDLCHVYTSILQGLQTQGQDEGHQPIFIGLALQVYEYLRPRYPDIRQIMLQIPDCKPKDLQDFDSKLLSPDQQKVLPEKRKRELYKKLVQGIIGTNVSQQFRKEVTIKNLPSLVRASRPAPDSMLDKNTTASDIGICSLFNSQH